MTHLIHGERVFLRPFEPTDAELYRRWRADAEPMALAGWNDRAPLSLAQAAARIDRLATDQGKDYYTFMICLLADERPIGEVALSELDLRNRAAPSSASSSARWTSGARATAPTRSTPSSASGSPSCGWSGSG